MYEFSGVSSLRSGHSTLVTLRVQSLTQHCRFVLQVERHWHSLHTNTHPRHSMFLIRKACQSCIPMGITFAIVAGTLLTKCQMTVSSAARYGSYTWIPNHSAAGLSELMKCLTLSSSSMAVPETGDHGWCSKIVQRQTLVRSHASIWPNSFTSVHSKTPPQTKVIVISIHGDHCMPMFQNTVEGPRLFEPSHCRIQWTSILCWAV